MDCLLALNSCVMPVFLSFTDSTTEGTHTIEGSPTEPIVSKVTVVHFPGVSELISTDLNSLC